MLGNTELSLKFPDDRTGTKKENISVTKLSNNRWQPIWVEVRTSSVHGVQKSTCEALWLFLGRFLMLSDRFHFILAFIN